MYKLKKTIKATKKIGGKIIVKKKCPHKDFEKKLESIRLFVEELNIKVYNGIKDGREVSKRRESMVVNPILDNFSWAVPKTNYRDYGDLYIKVVGGYLFPVNIKLISKLNKNFNNIAGTVRLISYLLYDERLFSYKTLANALCNKTSFTTEPRQYGMVVVNKTDSSVIARTIFNIHRTNIAVNPSNGLQFRLDGKGSVKRTQLTGQKFVADLLKDLLKKRAEPFLLLTGMGENI